MTAYEAYRAPAHVVIAGGGFAGLETLLAIRAMAEHRIPVTLIAPDPLFRYRPAATAEAFDAGPSRTFALGEIAAEFGATYHRARVESVGTETGYVRLSSGGRLPYDHLVLALGARARARIPGAFTFRDQRDLPLFRTLLRDLAGGPNDRLVFAIPPGPAYHLPVYELALLSAAYVAERHLRTKVSVVSPEPAPLAVFGEKPSDLVSDLLTTRRITFIGGAVPREVRHDGALLLDSGLELPASRVVAVPKLHGHPIAGIPSTRTGFLATDAIGQVEGLTGVYAAGDIIDFPIKQAGLASQQADWVAQRILAASGSGVPPVHRPRILQARLIGGAQPLFLWAELDEQGQATSASLAHGVDDLERGQEKVFARYLTPYLERLRSRVGSEVSG